MRTKKNAELRSTVGDEMFVRDVMTSGVLTVQKFDNVMHVAAILAERNISGLPVVDADQQVIGIVTQADILSMVGIRKEHSFRDMLKHALGERLPERKAGDVVADIMTHSPITTTPDANIAEIAQIMDEHKIRRLPVVDKQKRLVGIISRADILKAILRKLQQI
jgi:CBS domain-containing protein